MFFSRSTSLAMRSSTKRKLSSALRASIVVFSKMVLAASTSPDASDNFADASDSSFELMALEISFLICSISKSTWESLSSAD